MKRVFTLICILALGGGFVSGQSAWIHGWGDGAFVLYNMSKENNEKAQSRTGIESAWTSYPRLGFEVGASADTVGFDTDILFNDQRSLGNISIGDNCNIWVKPFNFLRLDIGRFKADELTGKFTDTDFWRYVQDFMVEYGKYDNLCEEDAIFSRFITQNGALLSITPFKALYIGAMISASPLPVLWREAAYEQGSLSKDVIKNIQVGAGYEIPSIGRIRAQYKGGNPDLTDITSFSDATLLEFPDFSFPVIEAAFDFNAITDLEADIGAKIPLLYTQKNSDGNTVSVQSPYQISMGASYTFDFYPPINIFGRIDSRFGAIKTIGSDQELKQDYDVNIHLVPSVDLDKFKLGMEAGFRITSETTRNHKIINNSMGTLKGGFKPGIGAWIQKDLTRGFVKTGLAFQLPTEYNNKRDFQLFIPVILTYQFL